jgi:hypothetical protein
MFEVRRFRPFRIALLTRWLTKVMMQTSWFQIVGDITNVETIAAGQRIREIERLRKVYGPGRWLKRKGYAVVRLAQGDIIRAEIHWYEAAGIGRKEFKIKSAL